MLSNVPEPTTGDATLIDQGKLKPALSFRDDALHGEDRTPWLRIIGGLLQLSSSTTSVLPLDGPLELGVTASVTALLLVLRKMRQTRSR